MTIYVKCDKCGITEEFKDGHYYPADWHAEYWDDIRSALVKEKHFCDKCWKKMMEAME